MRKYYFIQIFILIATISSCQYKKGCPDPDAVNFSFENPSKDNLCSCDYSPVSFYYGKDTIIKDSTTYTILSVKLRVDATGENIFTDTALHLINSAAICGLPDLYSFSPKYTTNVKRDFHWVIDISAVDTASHDTLKLNNYRFGKLTPANECKVIDVLK